MKGVNEDIDALRSDLADLRKDFQKLCATLQSATAHGREELLERAARSTADFGEEALGLIDELKRRPLSGALAAFALGVTVGTFLRGRR